MACLSLPISTSAATNCRKPHFSHHSLLKPPPLVSARGVASAKKSLVVVVAFAVAPNGGDGGDEPKRVPRQTWRLSWRDLLDPDPENIVAVGLTGLLTWASVQILFQLFFISLAIIVAALKYSFVAALLIFILITLL